MERESSLEQRERQDKEKAEARRARQELLGHVEKKAKAEEKKAEPKSESKPKSKNSK